jgi:hypothetical protein
MGTEQVDFSFDELLATHKVAEPLYAGGVRCHGGFDDEGRYVSPRTLNRWPAIKAWQDQHAGQFGTELLDAPAGAFPEHYPNVAQSKFLLSQGVRDPFVGILTRIGTVEGFGSMIRYVDIPEMQRHFDEEVTGTAMLHLGKGLYEAHARDEAGFDNEGGHKQMWFAARDVAFEHPASDDQTAAMLARMGFSGGGPAGGPAYEPLFPDVDLTLEVLIARMASLLLIEISAAGTFAWAEEVLADIDLVAGEGEASRLVSYIRQDEAPHVAYLRTVLSEMRDRTFVGQSGRKHDGDKVIGGIWDRAVSQFTGARRQLMLTQTLGEIELALTGHPRRGEILEEFHSLGSVHPAAPTTAGAHSTPSY